MNYEDEFSKKNDNFFKKIDVFLEKIYKDNLILNGFSYWKK